MASNEMQVAPANGQRATTGQSMEMVQTPFMFLQGRRVHFSSNVWRNTAAFMAGDGDIHTWVHKLPEQQSRRGDGAW